MAIPTPSFTTPEQPGRWYRGGIALAGFLLLAFLSRAATFGHPDLYVDETFYFAAGVEMLHGAIPFVDIWDRKPPGHFLLFAGIAAISDQFVTYQIVAAIFAGATAFVICRAARHLCGALAAGFGGATYLFSIYAFNGYGGQSAVFYNLFVALAALLLLASLSRMEERGTALRIGIAMLCAGLAVAIKTSAVFEAAFFGLFAAATQIRARMPLSVTIRRIMVWALLALLPSAAFALWYFLHGYWDEYWTAMVLSNLRKPAEEAGAGLRLEVIVGMLAPLLASAIVGCFVLPRAARSLLIGWMLAALVGFIALPSFYLHYALPLIAPLCVLAPAATHLRARGWILLASTAIPPLLFYIYVDNPQTQRVRAGMERLVDAVNRGKAGGGDLLVFDGPPLLYTMTGSPFPTPLAFPNHLYQAEERDVSHIPTLPEVRRLLAARPGVVVDRTFPHTNRQTDRLVRAYIAINCRPMASMKDRWGHTVTVYGLCRGDPTALSSPQPQN